MSNRIIHVYHFLAVFQEENMGSLTFDFSMLATEARETAWTCCAHLF